MSPTKRRSAKERRADEEAARCALIDFYGERGRFEDQMRCMRDDGPDPKWVRHFGGKGYVYELEMERAIARVVDGAPRLNTAQLLTLQRIFNNGRTSVVTEWMRWAEEDAEAAQLDYQREQVARAFASANRRHGGDQLSDPRRAT